MSTSAVSPEKNDSVASNSNNNKHQQLFPVSPKGSPENSINRDQHNGSGIVNNKQQQQLPSPTNNKRSTLERRASALGLSGFLPADQQDCRNNQQQRHQHQLHHNSKNNNSHSSVFSESGTNQASGVLPGAVRSQDRDHSNTNNDIKNKKKLSSSNNNNSSHVNTAGSEHFVPIAVVTSADPEHSNNNPHNTSNGSFSGRPQSSHHNGDNDDDPFSSSGGNYHSNNSPMTPQQNQNSDLLTFSRIAASKYMTGDNNDNNNIDNLGADGDDEQAGGENDNQPSPEKKGFRPSLRLVIACFSGLIILVVAVITLVLTNTISSETVKDLGVSLSKSYVNSATAKTQAYFDRPVTDLQSTQALFKKAGSMDPIDNPSMTADTFDDGMRMLLVAANLTYSTLGVFFDATGNLFGCLSYTKYNMYACGLRNNWPVLRNGSTFVDNSVNAYYINNHTRVPDHLVPSDLSLFANLIDARTGTYYAMAAIAKNTNDIFALPIVAYPDQNGSPVLSVPFFAPLRNASNTFLGVSAVALSSEVVNVFLAQIDKTPNSHIIAIDASLNVVASTHPAVISVSSERNHTDPLPSGCLSVSDVLYYDPDVIVCGSTVETYQYPPLNAIAGEAAFLTPKSLRVLETTVDKAEYFVVSSPVPNEARRFSLVIIFFLYVDDIMGEIDRARNIVIIITIVLFIIAIAVSAFSIFYILKPLNYILFLMDQASKLELHQRHRDPRHSSKGNDTTNSLDGGDDVDFSKIYSENNNTLSSISEIYDLQLAYQSLATSVGSFLKYLPLEIVKDLKASNTLNRIGMQPGIGTMMFCDIASFTSISERVSNSDLAIALAIFFEQMTKCLSSTAGLCVVLLGDGAFNCWNIPSVCPNHEIKAALCSLMLSRETVISPLSNAFDDIGERLYLRIGVNTGPVTHGNMGCSNRLQWSVYGNDVNLASRLEGQGKVFGTRILMSASTAEKCKDLLLMRYLVPTIVVGKEEPVKIFEPVGLLPHINLDVVLPADAENHHHLSSSAAANSQQLMQSTGSLQSYYNDNNSVAMNDSFRGSTPTSQNGNKTEFVSHRKNALITARSIVKSLLKCEHNTLKVSQYEMDFVDDFNQIAELFTAGEPESVVQLLQDLRQQYPLFFYGDDVSGLKQVIEDGADRSLAGSTNNNNKNNSKSTNKKVALRSLSRGSQDENSSSSVTGFVDHDNKQKNKQQQHQHSYHPKSRCEAGLIRAEASALLLEKLSTDLQKKIATSPPGSVTIDDFVYRPTSK